MLLKPFTVDDQLDRPVPALIQAAARCADRLLANPPGPGTEERDARERELWRVYATVVALRAQEIEGWCVWHPLTTRISANDLRRSPMEAVAALVEELDHAGIEIR